MTTQATLCSTQARGNCSQSEKIRQEKIKDVFSGSNNLVPGEVLLCGRVRRVSF